MKDVPAVAENDRSDRRAIGLRQHVVVGDVANGSELVLDPRVVGNKSVDCHCKVCLGSVEKRLQASGSVLSARSDSSLAGVMPRRSRQYRVKYRGEQRPILRICRPRASEVYIDYLLGPP